MAVNGKQVDETAQESFKLAKAIGISMSHFTSVFTVNILSMDPRAGHTSELPSCLDRRFA